MAHRAMSAPPGEIHSLRHLIPHPYPSQRESAPPHKYPLEAPGQLLTFALQPRVNGPGLQLLQKLLFLIVRGVPGAFLEG